ncbi:MAG: cytochrome b/b6 domain-containing protein [Bacteroidetes bacterium]|nr:cytochrome b/b6 domain-containing protein [Bacteroidota bacterium]
MTSIRSRKYLRMTLNERIQHFILLLSFIVLVITGFALKFPEALWVSGFRSLFGENAFEMRGDVHRVASVFLIGVSVYHLFYISFTKRGKEFIRDMWIRKSDYTLLKDTINYYRGKKEEKPKLGRFSYIEKLEYFAVYWGNFVMLITGVILWFENIFLPLISNVGMDIASAIHFYEAILASLSILFWHFYFVIYNPDVYPMNKAWITGYITRHQMETEHPLWLEEIEKDEMISDTENGKTDDNTEKADTVKKDEVKKDLSEDRNKKV